MLYQIKAYFNFLLRSTNAHGVQSPFVFDLVTKCFYDKTDYPDYKVLRSFRKSLYDNSGQIEVTDFGAGSKVFKSNKRKISDIARNAGISSSRAKLLFRIAKYIKPLSILEIGTSLGLATCALSRGNPIGEINTVEGCPQTAAAATDMFKKSGLETIKVTVSEFESYLKAVENKKFDLIYFDGNHRQESTLQYFEMLLPTIKNETVWIFDDIHWSAGMGKAWEMIKNHPKVTVTIDTFQWGLVFFRKEQAKENFTVRV